MARKEQDGKRESKSRMAMRQARGGQPPSIIPPPPPKMSGGFRSKAKEGRSGCIIASCTCAHEFQDQRYGAGRRVFNLGPSGGSCTVCGSKRGL